MVKTLASQAKNGGSIPLARSSPLAFPSPPLADAVVALRPWREADVERGLMLFTDALVQRFSWTEARPYTVDDARAYLEGIEAGRRAGRALELAVTEPGDEEAVLGCVSLFDVDPVDARAATGYWLAAHARGRGAATHAVRLLTGWAFATLGLHRIQLTCAPDNAASQAVAERCGFTREGVLRSHMAFKGGRRDTVVYGLVAGDR
jgi:RimJ/RimL family protein N-acetyltransferase